MSPAVPRIPGISAQGGLGVAETHSENESLPVRRLRSKTLIPPGKLA
jgi:hypothetical protein